MEVPTVTEDVTFQLVYSDGGATELQKDITNLYPIALLPYFLNVPTDQVELVMRADFGDFPDSILTNGYSLMMNCAEGDVDFLPQGYHAYFHTIFRAAKGIAALSKSPSVRIVSGHAYGNYSGGNLLIGSDVVMFSTLQPSNILTILDTCNAVLGVACMTGAYPANPRAFNSKYRLRMFKDSTIPVLCDRNEFVWAFQIGPAGEHQKVTGMPLSKLSLPFGDSIICCLILALKHFATAGSAKLQTYFETEYLAMNSSRMSSDIVNLKPHARLGAFEQLVRSSILNIDVAAVDACIMFQRRMEWFLSTEKPLQLSNGDKDFADKLINHVVGRVAAWHETHPNSIKTREGAEDAFDAIVHHLGIHGHRLLRLRLECDHRGKVVQDTEGTEFASWAISSAVMPKCLEEIRWAIRFGELESTSTVT